MLSFTERNKPAAFVTSFVENFAYASLIDVEPLSDVMLRLAEKMPLPDFNSVSKTEPGTHTAKRKYR